jgi:HD-GYP domain-containing protein (c-di-GMP phosphodiesterase class II)
MTEVENSSLSQALQHTILELTIAYDSTVEAFARAMELREGEPLGHTRQVTEVTIGLAKAMGVSIAEQRHIRCGAFLHDIGKMAVPDSILKKAGPLTDAEWEIMKLYPQHAYNLLIPIVFLHRAIEIPYCHHERWDGSGYPQGLKGDLIPLAARIFAVVDVWDALTSDRPQRKAWTDSQASEYIRNMAGKQFDPEIVAVFLDNSLKRKITRPLVK